MSTKKSSCPCCCGKKSILVLMSFLFMVAMSYVYAACLALPVSLLIFYFIDSVFGSFAQTFFCVTMSFGIIFLVVTILSRLAHLTLDDEYLSQTFFYDFLR